MILLESCLFSGVCMTTDEFHIVMLVVALSCCVVTLRLMKLNKLLLTYLPNK